MAYTATNWVEGVTTLGPTNMNKIETELAYLDARIAPAALGYGTTLPGSPVDGQEAILVDSTTNPSYQWRFRYNAGSSSAYKWEFVGGSAAAAYIATDETLSGTGAWLDPSTVGPLITTPRAGEYQATASVSASPSSAQILQLGIAVGAATPLAVQQANIQTPNAYEPIAITQGVVITGTAGGDIRCRYTGQTGTFHVTLRALAVWPKRVS
jgi:hypothetical protein